MTEEYNHYDVVIPRTGEFKGKKGMVLGNTSENSVPFVRVRFISHDKGEEDWTVRRMLLKLKDLDRYVPKNQLIRPLKIGDSVYLVDKLEVYYDDYEIKYQSSLQKITHIDSHVEESENFIYASEHLSFHVDSINIPRTNLLLFQPEKGALPAPYLPIL